MKEIYGISVSPGIAISRVFVHHETKAPIPQRGVGKHEISGEINRFQKAIKNAIEELERMRCALGEGGDDTRGAILDSHILMLGDPIFTGQIEERIEQRRQNAEWVLRDITGELVERLETAKHAYLQERTVDIQDVVKRVMNQLLAINRPTLADLESEVVIVAQDLLPSDTLQMNKRYVKGIAMDAGGRTSHTAILARAYEIPAVLGLHIISRIAAPGDTLVVDGNKGMVVVNPDRETQERYQVALEGYQKAEQRLIVMDYLVAARTKDGKEIPLLANIELPEETRSILSHRAEGIGLYRSEFLFLDATGMASEQTQFEAYSKVIKAMMGRPVTIRTLDVGGDKVISEIDYLHEKNPLLGWRAIRFCLKRVDLFVRQLRALLRASVLGTLKIMFPLVSGLEELEQGLEILEETKEALRHEGISFDEETPVGIMIEVPSAALISDILAKKVDFFSIGTNDLVQYSIAVDRGNEKLADLYTPFHPGVLRLISMTVENAHAQNIPVSMCGEMAGDPLAVGLLLGLGLDQLSMSAISLPEVRHLISSIFMREAEDLAREVMGMTRGKEIEAHLAKWLEDRWHDIPR